MTTVPHSYNAKAYEIARKVYAEQGWHIGPDWTPMGAEWTLCLAAVEAALSECSSGPEDEAVGLLIELHKFLDFEVPLQPGDMEIESPEGINEVFAKAYALINSRDATPQDFYCEAENVRSSLKCQEQCYQCKADEEPS
jgi:hypothetical protein